MLLATKTLGATRGGAVGGTGVGVGGGVGVGVGSGVGLGVADTVAVGLGDGAELAALGVPQAASNTGAISVSRAFLVICCLPRSEKGRRGRGTCPLPRRGKPRLPAFARLQESCSRARYSRHRYLYLAWLLNRLRLGKSRGLLGDALSWLAMGEFT